MLGNLDLTRIALFMVVLVIAITIHEMMHAFTARALGDYTAEEAGRITFNPLRHIDPVLTIALPLVLLLLNQPPILAAKPVPFRPDMVRFGDYGSALVGLAGPFTNLVLAAFGALLFHLFGAGSPELVYQFLLLFVTVNIGVFVFNMIPFPPLDGSRVLYAVAPDPVRRVMDTIESFGILGLVVLMVFLLPFLSPLLNTVNSALIRFLLT